MQYNLYSNDSGAAITVVDSDGNMHQATDSHPNWEKIVSGAVVKDESIYRLFDYGKAAAEEFERLSDRVTIANGEVYFDGEVLGGDLSEQILRFIEQDVQDWMPLVNFYEKIMTNLNEHTRAQLYSWLTKQKITITEDGDFLAYKGVRTNGDRKFFSIHSGKAIVNDKVCVGSIPNDVGSVIEMPRSEVQHDPSVGCHTGLHAGTWDYASSFAQGAVLHVKINPRDVVSVPSDCDSAKLRTCRYEVIKVVEQESKDALYVADPYEAHHEAEAEWGDGEEDEDLYY